MPPLTAPQPRSGSGWERYAARDGGASPARDPRAGRPGVVRAAMKRLLVLFCGLLAAAGPVWGFYGSDSDVKSVSSVQELKALLKKDGPALLELYAPVSAQHGARHSHVASPRAPAMLCMQVGPPHCDPRHQTAAAAPRSDRAAAAFATEHSPPPAACQPFAAVYACPPCSGAATARRSRRSGAGLPPR